MNEPRLLLRAHAQRLADAGELEAAADAWRVLADLEEERGSSDAVVFRTYAKRALIAAWATPRFPDRTIRYTHVSVIRRGRGGNAWSSDFEPYEFKVYAVGEGQPVACVVIDRRDRIRERRCRDR